MYSAQTASGSRVGKTCQCSHPAATHCIRPKPSSRDPVPFKVKPEALNPECPVSSDPTITNKPGRSQPRRPLLEAERLGKVSASELARMLGCLFRILLKLTVSSFQASAVQG